MEEEEEQTTTYHRSMIPPPRRCVGASAYRATILACTCASGEGSAGVAAAAGVIARRRICNKPAETNHLLPGESQCPSHTLRVAARIRKIEFAALHSVLVVRPDTPY